MCTNTMQDVRGIVLRLLVVTFQVRIFLKMYKGGHFACARGRNTAYTGGQFALPVVAMRMRFLEA